MASVGYLNVKRASAMEEEEIINQSIDECSTSPGGPTLQPGQPASQ